MTTSEKIRNYSLIMMMLTILCAVIWGIMIISYSKGASFLSALIIWMFGIGGALLQNAICQGLAEIVENTKQKSDMEKIAQLSMKLNGTDDDEFLKKMRKINENDGKSSENEEILEEIQRYKKLCQNKIITEEECEIKIASLLKSINKTE